MKKPIKTKRYCLNCQKMTIYEYDKMTGHSFCLSCGRSSLFAKFRKPKEVYIEQKNKYRNKDLNH